MTRRRMTGVEILWNYDLKKSSWDHGKWWLCTRLQKQAHNRKDRKRDIPRNRFSSAPGACRVTQPRCWHRKAIKKALLRCGHWAVSEWLTVSSGMMLGWGSAELMPPFSAEQALCPSTQEVGQEEISCVSSSNCFFRQKPVAHRTGGRRGMGMRGGWGPAAGWR